MIQSNDIVDIKKSNKLFFKNSFADLPWDSDLEIVTNRMKEIDFTFSKNDGANWIFDGQLPGYRHDIHLTNCQIQFGHYGLNKIVDTHVYINYISGSCYEDCFKFYLPVLVSKYGEPNFIEKSNEKAIWYDANLKKIDDKSGQIIVKKYENSKYLQIIYHNPDYNIFLEEIQVNRQELLARII